MGLDQIEPLKEEVMSKRPTTMAELLQFERTTGKVYSKHLEGELSDRWGTPYDQGSLLDVANKDRQAGR